jgi:hypothetical protein
MQMRGHLVPRVDHVHERAWQFDTRGPPTIQCCNYKDVLTLDDDFMAIVTHPSQIHLPLINGSQRQWYC